MRQQTSRKSRLTMSQRHTLEGFLFISPWILGFIILFTVPFFESVKLSLSKITKVSGFEMKFIGGANYVKAFVWDINFVPMLIDSIVDTVINTPLTVVFSLFIAILISREIKFRGFFRGSFFLPVLLGTGFVLEQLLGMQVEQQATEVARGIVMPEQVLMYLGPTVAKFAGEFLSRITLIFWQSGVQIIIFLAGLQSIPSSFYEAAKCDGATVWEQFWKITLPMLAPVILLNTVYTLVDSFTSSTNPIVKYILTLKTSITNYEYAAALGVIYFAFIFILNTIVYFASRKAAHSPSEK
jgi:ABC-type sugar transport system permease subunit